MSDGKIQQQYYTRGREGLFQGGEGFDTVAKSPGLDSNFIKKTLHPYCIYISPQELVRKGVRDLSRYPASVTVFPADTGQLVIGRSLISGSDYSGQRDVVFAHNYVVPPERREEFFRKPSKIFRITDFCDSYDEGMGKTLPELDDLGYSSEYDADCQDAVLQELGIGENVFKSMLYAIMMAVSSTKKVYISLDTDISELSHQAGRLLEIIYGCLPWEVRRHFGFTTYNNEPQGRKNIDVMFVEKDSIRSGDRSLGKDYLFDLPNDRYPAPDSTQLDYIHFAWEHRNHPEELAAYFEFAEEALTGLSTPDQLSIISYSQLSILYRVISGRNEHYQQNKEGIIESALRYLKVGGFDQKPRLNELILALLQEEEAALAQADSENVPIRVLAGFVDYYKLAPEEHKPRIITSMVEFLARVIPQGSNDEEAGIDVLPTEQSSYLAEAGLALKKQPELEKLIYERIGRDLKYASLSEALLTVRMGKVKTVKEFQEEVIFWVQQSLDSLGLPFFIDQFRDKLKRVLHKSGDQLSAGGHVYRFCAQLYKANAGRKGFETFCDVLEMETARSVLDSFSLGVTTYAELQMADYLITEDRLLTGVGLSEEQTKKLRIFRGVYEAFVNRGFSGSAGPEVADPDHKAESLTTNSSSGVLDQVVSGRPGSPNTETEPMGFTRKPPANKAFDFYDLTDKESVDVRELVRKYLKGRLTPEYYDTVVFAFTEWNGNRVGRDHQIMYFDMLRFVSQETEGTEGMYDFLLWTSGNRTFRDTQGKKLRPAYRNALRKYFLELDRKALKNNKIYKMLVTNSSFRDFREVIRAIRDEQTNPILRLLWRNRKYVTLSVLTVIVLTLAVMVISSLSDDSDKDGPASSTIPSGQQSTTPTTEQASPTPSVSDNEGAVSPEPSDSDNEGAVSSEPSTSGEADASNVSSENPTSAP